MYRLLALDLDGTLLNHDKEVDPRDIGAIAELRRSGVTVTIVTGRLLSGSMIAARACAIEGPIGCIEGSHVVEIGGATLAHHAIDDGVARMLRDTFRAHELAAFVFDAHGIHHDHAGAAFASYIATWSPNLRVVDEEHLAWDTAPLAAVAVGDERGVMAAAAVLAGHRATLFSVHFPIFQLPGKHALLVRVAGPTKGTALAELCRLAGCSLAEAVAVGDWVNDVPMFEVAGRSFAMGGAPEHVRAKATDALVTEAGAGGGVAEAIRRAWG